MTDALTTYELVLKEPREIYLPEWRIKGGPTGLIFYQ